MKLRRLITTLFLIIAFNAGSNVYAQYNATSAASYADDWCNDPTAESRGGPKAKGYNIWSNPLREDVYFNDYTLKGGDCANFVSQCLIKGGLRQEIKDFINTGTNNIYAGRIFDSSNPDQGQDPNEPDGIASGGTAGTIANTGKLNEFLTDYYHALYIYGKVPDNLDKGDVFLDFPAHSMFVATGVGTNSTRDAHTSDRWHYPIPSSYDDSYHFFHMVRAVPNVEHVEVKQGTEVIYDGRWSGSATPRSLNISQLPADTSDDLIITIDFNESVQNISVKAKDNSNTVSVSGALNPALSTQWIGTLTKSQFSSGQLTGEVTLVIEAQNYASSSNLLDADPKTVPQWRDATRDFTDYENASKNATNITTGGVDILHLRVRDIIPLRVAVDKLTFARKCQPKYDFSNLAIKELSLA